MEHEELRLALAARLETLLLELPKEDRDSEMLNALSILEQAGIYLDPTRESPRAFARELFLSPSLTSLMRQAAANQFNPESAESPEELVLNLTPSNGHLE
jgi:hypothetical protein